MQGAFRPAADVRTSPTPVMSLAQANTKMFLSIRTHSVRSKDRLRADENIWRSTVCDCIMLAKALMLKQCVAVVLRNSQERKKNNVTWEQKLRMFRSCCTFIRPWCIYIFSLFG